MLRFVHPRLTWCGRRSARPTPTSTTSIGRHADRGGREFARRHGKRSILTSDMDSSAASNRLVRARPLVYERGLAQVDRVVVQNARSGAAQELPARSDRHPELLPGAGRRAPGTATRCCGSAQCIPTTPELLLERARLPKRRFIMIGGSAAPGERLKPGYYSRSRRRRLPAERRVRASCRSRTERWYDQGRVLVNTSSTKACRTPSAGLGAAFPVATVDVGARIEGSLCPFLMLKSSSEVERLFADQSHWARASERVQRYFNAQHSSAEVLRRYSALFEEMLG